MKKQLKKIVLYLTSSAVFFTLPILPNSLKKPKIVGLLQVRNEEIFVKQCLKALAYYTDAIVVIDDASEDNTLKIIKKLAKKLHIEKIIEHKESAWQTKDESYNRQELLDAGRSIGGTHFVFVDADEMFSSACAKNNWLRKQILSLKKGQILKGPEVNLWDGVEYYRTDAAYDIYNTFWSEKPLAFCDDGVCSYSDNKFYSTSKIIHFSQEPVNRVTEQEVPRYVDYKDLLKDPREIAEKALIHFKYVNLNSVYAKRLWYMCFEFIRMNQKSNPNQYAENARKVNEYYKHKELVEILPSEKAKIRLEKAPKAWFEGYKFFKSSVYKKYNMQKQKEITKWLEQYGSAYFADLDIWHFNWLKPAKS